MKVFAFTEGTRSAPASRIRAYELLDRLHRAGALDYSTVSYTSEGYCRKLVAAQPVGPARAVLEQLWHLWAVIRLLAGAATSDCVLIQRTLLPRWLQTILKMINPRIVYDFDDAVYIAWRGREKRFSHQMKTAAAVAAVSSLAAEQAIERGAPRAKLNVIYTPVDCGALERHDNRRGEGFNVGWIGSPATSGYLRAIWSELEELALSNPGVRFTLIGCPEFDTGNIANRVRFVPWSPETEREELPLLNAGLMPLEDTAWERGKGGYKLIQYMAAGAAVVASPVGANLEIVDEERTGLFARGPGEWKSSLVALLTNRERCLTMGSAGRMRAKKMFDYGVAEKKFLEILQQVDSKK